MNLTEGNIFGVLGVPYEQEILANEAMIPVMCMKPRRNRHQFRLVVAVRSRSAFLNCAYARIPITRISSTCSWSPRQPWKASCSMIALLQSSGLLADLHQ